MDSREQKPQQPGCRWEPEIDRRRERERERRRGFQVRNSRVLKVKSRVKIKMGRDITRWKQFALYFRNSIRLIIELALIAPHYFLEFLCFFLFPLAFGFDNGDIAWSLEFFLSEYCSILKLSLFEDFVCFEWWLHCGVRRGEKEKCFKLRIIRRMWDF